MDGTGFDNLARKMGGMSSRRSVLKALLASVAAAGSVAGLGSQALAASRAPREPRVRIFQPRTRSRGEDSQSVCKPYGVACSRADGDCCTGLACEFNTTCHCPIGTIYCSGVCTMLEFDVNNSGACGNICGAGQSCTVEMHLNSQTPARLLAVTLLDRESV